MRELGTRVVVGAVEHPSVGGVCNVLESDGFEVSVIPVDGDGRIDMDRFAREVRRPGTLLASLHHANHELGTMQQIGEAGRLAREAGVRFHADACQTVGRLPVDVAALDVDLLSLSAHKFGGPPGRGALFVRRGVGVTAYPCGDDRERKRRAGMENIPGMADIAAALDASLATMGDGPRGSGRSLRGSAIVIERDVAGARVHGHPTHRMPHLVCFSVDGLDAATPGDGPGRPGVPRGTGSPCTGGRRILPRPGPARLARDPSFRMGLGPSTTDAEVEAFGSTLPSSSPSSGRWSGPRRRPSTGSSPRGRPPERSSR